MDRVKTINLDEFETVSSRLRVSRKGVERFSGGCDCGGDGGENAGNYRPVTTVQFIIIGWANGTIAQTAAI